MNRSDDWEAFVDEMKYLGSGYGEPNAETILWAGYRKGDWLPTKIGVSRLITALVRAVREDCAKKAEKQKLVCCEDEGLCGFVVDNERAIAAAIRGKR